MIDFVGTPKSVFPREQFGTNEKLSFGGTR